MKEIMLLIKKDFDRSFGFLTNPKLVMTDRKVRNALIGNVIAIGGLVFLQILFRNFISSFYENLVRVGLAPLIISSAFISSVVILCLLSIGIIVGEVFFNKDVDILLRFPIKPVNILISKLIFMIVSFGVIAVLFLLPLFTTYYEMTGRTLLFAIPAILSIFAHVAIVLSVFSFVVIFVMSFLNRITRIKNILQFLGLAFILFLNFYLQFYLRAMILKYSVESFGEMVFAYRFYVPQLYLITGVIQSESFLSAFGYGLSLFLISIISVYVFAKLSTVFMLKGIFANKMTLKSGSKKKTQKNAHYKERSVVMELAIKDIREMFKVPIYFFNVSIGAIMPVVLLVIAFFQEKEGNALKFVQEVRIFFEGLSMGDHILYGSAAGFLLAMVIGTMQQTAVSSITREGRRIWIIKVLPISFQDQINGRILGSMIFQLLGLLPSTAVLFFILFPSIFFVATYVIGAVIGAWFICSAGLFLDVLMPKLQWDTPQQAIKQNFKIALFTVISWGYLYGLFFFGSKVGEMLMLDLVSMKIVANIVILIHLVAAYLINRYSIRLIKTKLLQYE